MYSFQRQDKTYIPSIVRVCKINTRSCVDPSSKENEKTCDDDDDDGQLLWFMKELNQRRIPHHRRSKYSISDLIIYERCIH